MQDSELMPQMSDHDAIITLVSEVRNLGRGMNELKSDIKEVKENVAQRVSDLEREKLDIATADKMMAEAEKLHTEMKAAYEKVDTDHETRLRAMKEFLDNLKGKYAVIAFFVILGLNALVAIVIARFT